MRNRVAKWVADQVILTVNRSSSEKGVAMVAHAVAAAFAMPPILSYIEVGFTSENVTYVQTERLRF